MDIESFLLTVVDVIDETADARSVSFEVPADAPEKFVYKPGQFLTVAVPSDQTGIAARCYSLSSSPHDGGPLTVTVKRTVEGYASNWICDNLKVGDTLRVLPPSGIFTPASIDADLLLFAGGSGVTPIMSITRTALDQGTGKIVVFYANRDEKSVIFAQEFTRLAAENPERLQVVHWLESVQGIPSPEQIKAFVEPYLDYNSFVCGPAPYMKMVTTVLRELEFPRERRHQEKFVSLGGNPFGDIEELSLAESEIAQSDDGNDPEDAVSDEPTLAGPVKLEVELDGESHTFDDWDPKVRLLDFLEGKGVKAPYSCREGECSACAIRLIEGDVRMLHNDVLDSEDLADGIRLGCQSVPTTDTVRVTYS
ncbi:ferredoxin--NADP reductase [Nocardioides humilatus]|uniref:Ferredoxin--NADP reductase n=1 Tax=Nocardioides humilatus TaxID=2607660 RepID=A0A5B1L9L0_9ACTN|nr:ferredoxin--NADP reductase [Nocardioides humilatus]KAA1417096.1 ferredoxin--NADP reductase [Nocardioides humilatus]